MVTIKGVDVALLVIDLQEGFSDDTVEIQVGEQRVFHKEGVNTDYAIGLADSVGVQIHAGFVKVGVSVVSSLLSESIMLKVSTTVYLGVSIVDNVINFIVPDERFLYY